MNQMIKHEGEVMDKALIYPSGESPVIEASVSKEVDGVVLKLNGIPILYIGESGEVQRFLVLSVRDHSNLSSRGIKFIGSRISVKGMANINNGASDEASDTGLFD